MWISSSRTVTGSNGVTNYTAFTLNHNHPGPAWYGCGTVLSSLQGVRLHYKCITVPKQ